MYANIANFIVDVLLNMNKSNELYNLQSSCTHWYLVY